MMYLTDTVLGQLDLECANKYVVSSFTIGFPTVRSVVNPLALTDGTVDTTTYLGERAVTVAIRLIDKDCAAQDTQELLDALLPYLSPRRRPRLVYSVREPVTNPANIRTLTLRGVDAPIVVDSPHYLTIICQWVAAESYQTSLDDTCVVANFTGGAELGRAYDLTFDRTYPASPPFGITQFTTLGNAPMDWTGTITSQITDPEILINTTLVTFAGLSLLPGQTIIIDTAQRTMLRNGDPTDSVYGFSNFANWTWDDLRLVPGLNSIRLEGTLDGGAPAFTLCYHDAWY